MLRYVFIFIFLLSFPYRSGIYHKTSNTKYPTPTANQQTETTESEHERKYQRQRHLSHCSCKWIKPA